MSNFLMLPLTKTSPSIRRVRVNQSPDVHALAVMTITLQTNRWETNFDGVERPVLKEIQFDSSADDLREFAKLLNKAATECEQFHEQIRTGNTPVETDYKSLSGTQKTGATTEVAEDSR